jgi:hypothetical protein
MEKTFLTAFGKPYNVDLLPLQELKQIINGLSDHEIVSETLKQLPEISGAFCVANLNCETGEVEYFSGLGNTGLIYSRHLVQIYRLRYQDVVEIPEEDILGDSSLTDFGVEEVEELPDYFDRIVECLLYYIDYSLNYIEIERQIQELYA